MLAGLLTRLARPRAGAAALSTAPSSSLSHAFSSRCGLTNRGASPSPSPWPSPSRSIVTVTSSAMSIGGIQRRPRPIHLPPPAGARSFSSKDGDDARSTDEALPDTVSGSSQHDTWVQYQRSISVSGFDTGQTVVEKTLDKKNRGGAMARKRKEREAEAEAALKGNVDTTQLKGGEFPALRYSDEETERLLAEAYAAIPPRAGKRGTLNLKRQKRRWFIKRQYDYKKKRERMAAAERKRLRHERIRREIVETREGAVEVRDRDVAYHNLVLQRWADANGHNEGLGKLETSRREELAALGWKIGETSPEAPQERNATM